MPNTLDELKQHAKKLACSHGVSKKGKLSRNLFPRIEEDDNLLIEAYKKINEEVKAKENVVPAAEWLLDNFYMIEEQVKDIQHGLSETFYKELPLLESGKLKGFPRVYAIADEMVSYTDGQVDEEAITVFLKEYQSVTPLSSAEIWAIPFMLKIALIKKIKEIAVHIVESQKMKKEAARWAEKLLKVLEQPIEEMQKMTMEHDRAIGLLTPSYAEGLLQHLREYGSEAAPMISWLDGKLALQGTTADEIIQVEHQQQAGYQLSIGNSVTALKYLSSIKWEELFEDLSPVEQILKDDPEGSYPCMEFPSRDYYRHQIEKIAKSLGESEMSIAESVVECARKAAKDPESDPRSRHVGYYLVGKGRKELEKKLGVKTTGLKGLAEWINDHPTFFYLGSITVLTLGIFVSFLYYIYASDINTSPTMMLLSGVVAFIPILTLAIGVVNWVVTQFYNPCHLPKLELKDGIPEEFRTMVVIPTLLSSEERVWELVEQMEVFYLANQEKNLHFALVGDFKDSNEEHGPEDKRILEAATKAIQELNDRYGQEKKDIFFFFHRHRRWNPSQGKWMGWERKRGALVEFNKLLRGESNTGFSTQIGDLSVLPSIKYVITLDADTQLPRDAAKRLIGTLAHPLNRPLINDSLNRVTEGYGLLQPRISVAVDSASRSVFALTFSGQTGVDPYTTAVSDVYQDLFGEGIFTGKGIYDVDVFNKVLGEAIPENTVLSHDLLEGSHVRTGLVTDIELIDSYPSHYIAYAMRLHRWVRGDWQLVPWLFSRVRNGKGEVVKNPLTLISKWKIIDNIRRSLLAPALSILLALGLTVLPGSSALWLGLAMLTLAFPLVVDLVSSLVSGYRKPNGNRRLSDVVFGARNLILQISLTFVFLLNQAYLMSDAIVRTIIRMYYTKRNMLEWVTAADTERKFKGQLRDFWWKMWPSMVMAVLFFTWVALYGDNTWPIALVMSMVWVSAPWVAYKVSQPKHKEIPSLTEEQIKKLRMIARKTWRYFEDFVGPRDNWLPPDNFQEEPPVGIAHRTSPTNIGILLVSTLGARDLGYIGTVETIERLEKTFDTLKKLEKWNGHFYNWYNTKTLKPLKPEYVSSVDSGNLASYLLIVKQGIEELINKPLVGRELVQGLEDSVSIQRQYNEDETPVLLKMLKSSDRISLTEWKIALNDLKSGVPELETQLQAFIRELDELVPWVDLLLNVPKSLLRKSGTYNETVDKFNNLIDGLNNSVTLMDILENYNDILDKLSETIASLRRQGHKDSGTLEAKNWLKQMELTLGKSYISVKKFVSRCKNLVDAIDNIVREMNFGVLYDEKLELFSIGYDIESGKLSNSYYDLLASEARQTSFIAIAKGDIPQKHWFKLGRPLTMVGDLRGLLSWSGTMFEYLLPLLIMKSYDNTLLNETYYAVLEAQKQYGEQRHVPWGISESAFYAFDLHLNYQYKAFGVPRMGMKRGLVDDIVVAPYATVLALLVDPVAAMRNIELLMAEGMNGQYGLYEAIDYTPERIPRKKKSMVVKSFMVHHQGMSFLALDNYLNHNIMQERFHSLPMVKATELLLQERIPKNDIYIKKYEQDITDIDVEKNIYEEIKSRRKYTTADTPIPEAHIISNGNYSVVLTNAGGGFSQIQGVAINRWRQDYTRDDFGMFFYIHNLNSNDFWSATFQPCGVTPDEYTVVFEPDRGIYSRRDGNLETKTEVVVSPEHNVEVRRISITNHSEHGRVVEVTSYFEPVLASQEQDLAHPAFAKLFIETEYIDEYKTLLATRRPRDKSQKPLWLVHTLVLEGEGIGSVQYETDRAKFIGRNRDLRWPQAMEPEHPLSNTTGAVLDPIMSLRQRIGISPGNKAKLSYITAVAETRENAIALAREYQSAAVTSRAFELAWTHSQVEMRYLNITSGQASLYQKMVANIIFPGLYKRDREEVIARNTKGQSALWAYGVSGDLPIVLVRIAKIEHMEIVRKMLSAHEYWRLKGLIVDLVVINEHGNSYEQPVQDQLRDLISISHARDLQNKPGGVFLLAGNVMPDEDKDLFVTAARLVISGDKGSIASQLKAYKPKENLPPIMKVTPLPISSQEKTEPVKENLMFFNEIGGFVQNGHEYVIRLNRDLRPPMPWSNIISNPHFGFLVTESGSGYTWYGNSRENKLTPWSNDPVVDPPGEVVYLRDEDTGEFWTITPSPIVRNELYTTRHGHGYSVFEHISHEIQQQQKMFVSLEYPVKFYYITLRNLSDKPRNITLTFYVEWVLGVNREKNSQFIVTERDERTGAILARNPYNEQFATRIAFIDTNIPVSTYTGDRTEFVGRNGSLANPAALNRQRLSGRLGAGYDPCGALQVRIDVKPGDEKKIVFILGQGDNIEHIRTLVSRFRNISRIEEAFNQAKNYWYDKLRALQVDTPDPSMDILLNSWLLYQAYCCRLLARTGFYQAGGAYGFRDQLQDVLALVYSTPERIREQILLCSEHQFREGDVQHWWHPPYRGIRTRITDDLLFLPFVTSDYIEITGDWSVLDEKVHFLEDEPLKPEEESRYNIPRLSEEKTSVYEHCIRAIERSLAFGVHGLPLIGTGDWNDGMDSVGDQGKGESVWLGWFLYTVLDRFVPICRARNDIALADKYKKIALELKESIEKNGWDGGWYRRAYFDDGTPLGSEKNTECQIDSISQSWAVISGAAKPSRVSEAMKAVENYLVRREEGLIKLLVPPFDKSPLEPGYIKGYVPGVRENGGQYTHAAAWVIMAFAKLGEGDKAAELYHLINPVNHARTWIELSRYKVEPYVMAADVYAVEPHIGRGGWTWYTGSASWMYRVGVEWILGFKLKGHQFSIDPCIPKGWTEYSITYRYKRSVYNIKVKNPHNVNRGVRSVVLDGQELQDKVVPLINDGIEHNVLVVMGKVSG